MTIKKNIDLTSLVRKNILNLKPYSSARDEFAGDADIYLDANENPYPSPFNRYPDPLQWKVKEKISAIKGVPATQIFLGNGSDEAIDLLIRAFCEPNHDSILITEPTYGMYSVCAGVNAVDVQTVVLTPEFDLDVDAIQKAISNPTKIIFLCSPNNPSGNSLDHKKILEVLKLFDGLVVIDEAYIDFSQQKSFANYLPEYPNLVIMQTFSKAWGLAGLRLGMAFASVEITNILNKIKYPYNINIQTQTLALEALKKEEQTKTWVNEILAQRDVLATELGKLSITEQVYPTDANFILIKVKDAPGIYNYLMQHGIIVRDRSKVKLCKNCLRITVGTPEENKALIESLKKI